MCVCEQSVCESECTASLRFSMHVCIYPGVYTCIYYKCTCMCVNVFVCV